MLNMKTIINSCNHKIINPKTITKERTCNCIDKAKCPPSQSRLINNIIYKVVLTSTHTTKNKSTSPQLKIHTSYDTQTIKDHLSF